MDDTCSVSTSSLIESWQVEPHPLTSSMRDEMVFHYFEVVHDTHHSLFHRTTFEVDIREGRIANGLVYAIVALGSRYNVVDCFARSC